MRGDPACDGEVEPTSRVGKADDCAEDDQAVRDEDGGALPQVSVVPAEQELVPGESYDREQRTTQMSVQASGSVGIPGFSRLRCGGCSQRAGW